MRRLVITTVFACLASLGVLAVNASAVTIPNGICNVVKSPRTLYTGPPVVTAFNDDLSSTDVNIIRYWVRFVDADTGALVNDWVYGGQGDATDNAAAVFPSASLTGGYQFWVYDVLGIPNRVVAEYRIAWYRTNWTLRWAQDYRPSSYRVKAIAFGAESYIGYASSCGPNPGY